jgi:hypothetical protein
METNRSLLISLIKEDLRCSKLVLGLSDIGLDAGKYHTELSNIIFNLVGLDVQNDQLMTQYFEWIDKVTEVDDVEDIKMLEAMAEDIYQRLLEAKQAEEAQ